MCDDISDDDIAKYNIGNFNCDDCPNDVRTKNILRVFDGLEDSDSPLFCARCHDILVTISRAGVISRDKLERLEEFREDTTVRVSHLNLRDPLRLASHSSMSYTVADFL